MRLWRDGPVGPDARIRARDPLRHEAGRIAVLRDAVDVGHYQAVTAYFAVQFRAGALPAGRELAPQWSGRGVAAQVMRLLARSGRG